MEQKPPSFKNGSATRRQFLSLAATTLGAIGITSVYSPVSASFAASTPSPSAPAQEKHIMTLLKLPALPYDKNALAPAMSAETLDYHHGKHHQAYVDNGNKLIEQKNLGNKSVEEIMIDSFGNNELAGVFNNVSQYWNHNHFWNMMTPNGGGDKLPSNLDAAVKSSFGGFDQFREKFIADGLGQFGSGWVWLVSDDKGNLSTMKTLNGENPLVHGKHTLLGCDVWEHSYYIDYRNARQKYLESFVDKLVNWDYVSHLYQEAQKKAAA